MHFLWALLNSATKDQTMKSWLLSQGFSTSVQAKGHEGVEGLWGLLEGSWYFLTTYICTYNPT